MDIFQNMISRLEKIRTRPLSLSEKEELWSRIESKMTSPLPSPFWMNRSRSFAALLVVFVIFGGAGTTIAFSGRAKPGDVLFPLSVVKERVVLSVIPEEHKDEVRLSFAEKRIEQGNEILNEIHEASLVINSATSSARFASSTPSKKEKSRSSDTSKRLDATISYLEDTKNDLSFRGNEKAAKKVQEAIEKIEAEAEDGEEQEHKKEKRERRGR